MLRHTTGIIHFRVGAGEVMVTIGRGHRLALTRVYTGVWILHLWLIGISWWPKALVRKRFDFMIARASGK